MDSCLAAAVALEDVTVDVRLAEAYVAPDDSVGVHACRIDCAFVRGAFVERFDNDADFDYADFVNVSSDDVGSADEDSDDADSGDVDFDDGRSDGVDSAVDCAAPTACDDAVAYWRIALPVANSASAHLATECCAVEQVVDSVVVVVATWRQPGDACSADWLGVAVAVDAADACLPCLAMAECRPMDAEPAMRHALPPASHVCSHLHRVSVTLRGTPSPVVCMGCAVELAAIASAVIVDVRPPAFVACAALDALDVLNALDAQDALDVLDVLDALDAQDVLDVLDDPDAITAGALDALATTDAVATIDAVDD